MTARIVSNPLASVTAAELELLARIEHYFLELPYIERHPRPSLVSRALLSANLFGGLTDPSCWQDWIRAILRARRISSHDYLWFQVEGEEQQRRWYPDPITGLLLRKLREQYQAPIKIEDITAPLTMRAALAEIEQLAEGDPDIPVSVLPLKPETIARICAARLHLRLPGLLADHASGRIRTSTPVLDQPISIKPQKMDQLARFLESGNNSYGSPYRPFLKDQGFGHLRNSFFPADWTTYRSRRLSGQAQRKALTEQLEFWSKTSSQRRSLHYHILQWLQGRLSRQKATLKHQRWISPSTARRYLTLLGQIDWSDVRGLPVDDAESIIKIEEKFAEILKSTEILPLQSRATMRAILVSLSEYLPGMATISLPVTPRQASVSSRAMVFDAEGFTQILEALRQWGEGGRHNERAWACRLAAILMFRTGLRGMEVTKLAINDIVFEDDMAELVVRASAERSNKTRYSRRVIPLHLLLEPEELAALQEWHRKRCDEVFWAAPRAKLFRTDLSCDIDLDQYLLEPIDAAIRLLMGDKLDKATRGRSGYWYSLASPLRRSFANHLFATLMLPGEALRRPLPANLTTDLVSLERKQKLTAAFLKADQHGLSNMQVIRQLMGHGSYERSMGTYIHCTDLLLGLHLWRDVHQPPLTQNELESLLGTTLPASLTKVGERQRRRHREKVAATISGSLGDKMKLKRGRPSSKEDDSRKVTVQRQFLAHTALDASAFSEVSGTDQRQARVYALPLPVRDWRALNRFLQVQADGQNMDGSELARRLGLPESEGTRWMERARMLGSVRKKSGNWKGNALPEGQLRFPQLSAGWFQNPKGSSAELLDTMWVPHIIQRLEISKHWRDLLRYLSKWQQGLPFFRSSRGIERYADFLIGMGVPATRLVVRKRGGDWQRYVPGSDLVYEKGEFQLTAAIAEDGKGAGEISVQKTLHGTILRALLMMAISGRGDLSSLTVTSSKAQNDRQGSANYKSRRL